MKLSYFFIVTLLNNIVRIVIVVMANVVIFYFYLCWTDMLALSKYWKSIISWNYGLIEIPLMEYECILWENILLLLL